MASENEHIRTIKELLEDLNEKIREDTIVQRQKIVGFSTSEISCNLFAIFLHRKNLIPMGFNVNHRFFVSEKSSRLKFNFDFPQKGKILGLLIDQERCRSLLCYGKEKERMTVETSIKTMLSIKKIVEDETGGV